MTTIKPCICTEAIAIDMKHLNKTESYLKCSKCGFQGYPGKTYVATLRGWNKKIKEFLKKGE